MSCGQSGRAWMVAREGRRSSAGIAAATSGLTRRPSRATIHARPDCPHDIRGIRHPAPHHAGEEAAAPARHPLAVDQHVELARRPRLERHLEPELVVDARGETRRPSPEPSRVAVQNPDVQGTSRFATSPPIISPGRMATPKASGFASALGR